MSGEHTGMDVVYPVGGKPSQFGKELIYSLRSVDRFLPGTRVWIIGEVSWQFNPAAPIRVIRFPDLYEDRHQSVAAKILMACWTPEVSDPFMLMNDDFYFLAEPVLDELPYYFASVERAIACHKSPKYLRALVETYLMLHGVFGERAVLYETHSPLIVHKVDFVRAMAAARLWSCKAPLYRSVYGNIRYAGKGNPGTGVERDFKIYADDDIEALAGAWVISSLAEPTPATIALLRGMFPKPSCYEV